MILYPEGGVSMLLQSLSKILPVCKHATFQRAVVFIASP